MRATFELVELECRVVGKKVNRKTQVQKPNLGYPPRQFDCERGLILLTRAPDFGGARRYRIKAFFRG